VDAARLHGTGKDEFPMQLDFTTVPLPSLRCYNCNRKFGEAATYGLMRFNCPRCKQVNFFIDGLNVQGQKEMQPPQEPTPPKVHVKPPEPAEIMAMMEERWRELQLQGARRKAEIAVGLRFKVFMRDEFRCQYCGHSAEEGAVLEADHVIPRSKGGLDIMENLITACWDCNRGKSDKILDAIERKEVPVG